MPTKMPGEDIGHGTVYNSICICLSLCIVPGVKSRWDISHIPDDDIIGKHGIEPLFDGIRGEIAPCNDMTYLTQCMDPCIGPAGGNEGDRLPEHHLEFFFYGLLKRTCIFLPLPPMVPGPVISQSQLDVPRIHPIKKGNP